MAKKRLIDLQYPMGGLHRRYAYSKQPPYSTPDCCNVRPDATIEGRERGGSRPGLGKAFYEELGDTGGSPIRLLTDVTVAKTDGLTFWQDNFKGLALGAAWSTASWIGTPPNIISEELASVEYDETVGAVRTVFSGLDVTQVYYIDLFLAPYEAAFHGTYSIFARMNDTTPIGTTDGIVADLTMTGDQGAYSGNLTVYVAGTPTVYAFTGDAVGPGYATAGWFRVKITVDNVKCYWLDTEILDANIAAQAGTRIGFGMNCTVEGGICLVDTFRLQYFDDNIIEENRKILVASSFGKLYRETITDTMGVLTTSLTLNPDRLLTAAEHLQELVIADHGLRAKGTDDGAITNTNELNVSGFSGITDWTALGVDVQDDVVVLLDCTTPGNDGTYLITSVTSTVITLTATLTNENLNAFRIERAPKIYDPVADTLAIYTATTGQVPTGCQVVCRYRDRIVMAMDQLWYMSRSGDHYDYDYSGDYEDATRAIAGPADEAGRIGENVLALVPHNDDYLVFGCENSLWIMRGDPGYGGQIDNLSHMIGIIDRGAWCRGPAGELIFLSRDGLYMLGPGLHTYPQSISREKVPREMLDVDCTLYTVTMAYDVRDRGVHIYLTPDEEKQYLHYWFDFERGSFWPFKMQNDHEPTATHAYMSQIAEDSAVLLGCRDGYIRRYRRRHETDDGTEIDSYVDYGPIRMGRNDYIDGILTELTGVLADDSGSVTWALRVADTHEAVAEATAVETGTWLQNLNYKARPRRRGFSMILRLTNAETDRAWAVERITAVLRDAGHQRRY